MNPSEPFAAVRITAVEVAIVLPYPTDPSKITAFWSRSDDCQKIGRLVISWSSNQRSETHLKIKPEGTTPKPTEVARALRHADIIPPYFKVRFAPDGSVF